MCTRVRTEQATKHGLAQGRNGAHFDAHPTLLNSSNIRASQINQPGPFKSSRGLLTANEQLAAQLTALDKRLSQKLDTHDQAITGILNTLRALMPPPTQLEPVPPPKRPIGFVHPEEKKPPHKPKAGKR